MRKLLVIILLLACLASASFAKLGIGLGTSLFSLKSYDETSGYGFNFTADFGFSPASVLSSIFCELLSFGYISSEASFYTASLTKDFGQFEASRIYGVLGAALIRVGLDGATAKDRWYPMLGIGVESFNVWGNENLAWSFDLCYAVPSVAIHYYF